VIIQTMQGNFIQYRMICAVNCNVNKITASLHNGEHHDIWQSDNFVTYDDNEVLNVYMATKNITERYLLQTDINSYMKRNI
jgi:hypothetical protein